MALTKYYLGDLLELTTEEIMETSITLMMCVE